MQRFCKKYFDNIEECPVFVRREECKHFKIAMKRISDDGKFQKFVITFVYKGCRNEEKLVLKENKKIYEYKCFKCNYSPMTFGYQNTMDDNELLRIKMKKRIINMKEEIFVMIILIKIA